MIKINGKRIYPVLIAVACILTTSMIPSHQVAGIKLDKAIALANYNLSTGTEGKLHQNGFIVIPEGYKNIYQIYRHAHQDNIPIFVTTDVILHTAHLLFDYTLRLVEIEGLKEELINLTRAMLTSAQEQYKKAKDKRIREAVRRNMAFFSVAWKLLGGEGIPDLVGDTVTKELNLIENHQEIAKSPLFDYKMDYTQFTPRGHYTRNKEFKRYFQAMIWYGKMMFRLRPGEDLKAVEKGQKETLSALLITRALKASEVGFKRWHKIYDTTSFLVGETDNLQAKNYLRLMEKIYGSVSTIVEFASKSKLDQFIDQALALKKPKILPTWAAMKQIPIELSQGFCFLGQRFIPDSYVFQKLIYPKVGTLENPRIFPKGLDVMATLGSKEAERILKEQGDFDYKDYEKQLLKLREEFSLKSEEEWTQNLYWHWFYSIKPLLKGKKGGPTFSHNQAWLRKELNTALGSWTELRHDTMLYAKPSVTTTRGIKFFTKGYVEPYPKVYNRIASLTEKMRKKLSADGLLNEVIESKLTKFENLVIDLRRISEKELKTEKLTKEQYMTIWNIADTLESIVELPEAIQSKIISGEDERMALIVDIHTDPQTGKVLEEAVGNAFTILVVVKVEGQVKIAQGGIFSYYEFKQPISEKLTDRNWHQMLKIGEEPLLPAWTKSFLP